MKIINLYTKIYWCIAAVNRKEEDVFVGIGIQLLITISGPALDVVALDGKEFS